MNLHEEVQFVGGPLDGEESSVWELEPEFHFPRLRKIDNWFNDTSYHHTNVEDIYVRLADTNIYIFKGTVEK